MLTAYELHVVAAKRGTHWKLTWRSKSAARRRHCAASCAAAFVSSASRDCSGLCAGVGAPSSSVNETTVVCSGSNTCWGAGMAARARARARSAHGGVVAAVGVDDACCLFVCALVSYSPHT